MEDFWHVAETKIAVNIYSNPNFALETFLGVFLCFVFGTVLSSLKLQCRSRRLVNCAPQLQALMPAYSTSSSSDTLCTGMAYADSNSEAPTIHPKRTFTDKYNFLTFDEFLQNTQEENAVKSLRSLCNQIIEKKSSERTIRRHLEMAKEHLLLAKCSLGSGDHQEMAKVTDSLFELLQRIILSTNSGKPFPFRGDMMTLAAEIADLSLNVEIL